MIGGDGQGTSVYSASLPSLLVGAPKWSSSFVPCEWSSPVVFGNRPVVLGGFKESDAPSAAIYSLSTTTSGWIYVGDMPESLYSACTIVKPTGELMVVGGTTKAGFSDHIFKATLSGMYRISKDKH